MTGPEAIAAAERLLMIEQKLAAFVDGCDCYACQDLRLLDLCAKDNATLRAALLQSQEALKQRQELIEVIYTTTRTDEKSECWTIRKYLDARNIFNDDIAGSERLIEIACAALLSPPVAPKEQRTS